MWYDVLDECISLSRTCHRRGNEDYPCTLYNIISKNVKSSSRINLFEIYSIRPAEPISLPPAWEFLHIFQSNPMKTPWDTTPLMRHCTKKISLHLISLFSRTCKISWITLYTRTHRFIFEKNNTMSSFFMRIAMQENIYFYFWYHPHMWHKTRNMFFYFLNLQGYGHFSIPTHLQVLLLQLVVDYF